MPPKKMTKTPIELAHPVIVDRVAMPKIIAHFETRLQAADQELEYLRQVNQSLKEEVELLNEQAFHSEFADEDEGDDGMEADEEEEYEDYDSDYEEEDDYDSEQEDGDRYAEPTGSASIAARMRRRPERKHHGETSSKKATKSARSGFECHHQVPRKWKTLHVRVMTTEGKAFQAMVEQQMLDRYPEMEIYTDTPKIIFKKRSSSK